jgi:hypothetical protein
VIAPEDRREVAIGALLDIFGSYEIGALTRVQLLIFNALADKLVEVYWAG